MTEFKPGDRVKCIDADFGTLIEGNVYTVKRMKTDAVIGRVVVLEEAGNGVGGYFPKRFELAKEAPALTREGKGWDYIDAGAKPAPEAAKPDSDPVTHPSHYTGHPSGVECIDITSHMNFCRGNAIKYLWRAGEKDKAKEIEDLRKAIFYIEREIKRLETTN